MRNVRRLGRRTWLAGLGGGALAVVAGLKLGGRDGYGIRIALPDGRPAAAQGMPGHDMAPYDTLRIPLGRNGFTTAYVLVRGGEAALVDTGVAGSAARIGEVIQGAGLGWDAIKHVIVTHHHGDHAGSVGEVLALAPAATVWAGAPDIPSIRAPRDIQAADDGDEIFGLQIIGTPGHTLGHISVFDPVGSALVLGDAVTNIGGGLTGSPAPFTADATQARETLRKIAAMTFETAWFMHGDPIQGGASAAFQSLVAAIEASGGLAHAAAPDHACT